MSGHLCLKWNNHSSAFLKSISTIQIKEKYCDATIACQGKYFPVHRIILSTCSDYFEEMFERMQCQHPYIVFKDIEPKEMELLLDYMYQGEVNVVQEMLPTLIKAAEALRVKGLAVPDEMPSSKDSSTGRKRSSTSNDIPQPKRRSEESRKRQRESSDLNPQNRDKTFSSSEEGSSNNVLLQENEQKNIKEEPLHPCDYEAESSLPSHPNDSQPINEGENVFVNFPISNEESNYNIKTEDDLPADQPYEEQSSTWNEFIATDVMENLPPNLNTQDDMPEFDQVSGHDGLSVPWQTGQLARNPVAQATPHGCHLCSYTSIRKADVKRHISFKHKRERPFACPLCPSRFIIKQHLVRHSRTHGNDRPYLRSET